MLRWWQPGKRKAGQLTSSQLSSGQAARKDRVAAHSSGVRPCSTASAQAAMHASCGRRAEPQKRRADQCVLEEALQCGQRCAPAPSPPTCVENASGLLCGWRRVASVCCCSWASSEGAGEWPRRAAPHISTARPTENQGGMQAASRGVTQVQKVTQLQKVTPCCVRHACTRASLAPDSSQGRSSSRRGASRRAAVQHATQRVAGMWVGEP